MSIDIAAEVKFSFNEKDVYFVRLQDADQTVIGKVVRTSSGWNAYDLDDRPHGGNGNTRYLASRPLLEAYELANGLRDSEGRRVGRDPETKGFWVVLSPIGTKQSPRWTDKADAIAHLASLNSLTLYKLVIHHTTGTRVYHFGDFDQALSFGEATDPEKDGSIVPNLPDYVMERFGGVETESYQKSLFWLRTNRYAAIFRVEVTGLQAELYRDFIKFQEIGRQAALNDEPAAPAANAEVMAALENRAVGDPFNARIMDAFVFGYQAARDQQAQQVLAESADAVDQRRCIEAGEHLRSSRHIEAECTGIVDDRPDETTVAEEPKTDRELYVTEQVSLWIQNDGDHIERARTLLKDTGPGSMQKYLTFVITDARPTEAPWHVLQELAPNDWDRIDWAQIARDIAE